MHLCLLFSTCRSETLFPGNEVARIYHEIAKKVMSFVMNFSVIQEVCCVIVGTWIATKVIGVGRGGVRLERRAARWRRRARRRS